MKLPSFFKPKEQLKLPAPDKSSPLKSDEFRELKRSEASVHFRNFLESLGLDLNDPNLIDTPDRVAKMYLDELFSGTWQDPPKVTKFDVKGMARGVSTELIITGPITIRSTCSHHFMPIVGQCFIGVLAGKDELPGLSKYARIAEHCASRPQLQEMLTKDISDEINRYFGIEHIGVVIKAKHFCMSHRGVKDSNSIMTTSSMVGSFRKGHSLRTEFLSLIQNDWTL